MSPYGRVRKKGTKRLLWILIFFAGMTFTAAVILIWSYLVEGNWEPIHSEDGFADQTKVQANLTKGKRGTFSYIASVEHGPVRVGSDDSRKPKAGCNFLMVIRFKYPLSDGEKKALKSQLDNLMAEGVIEEHEVFVHAAVINKFCGPREISPDREQWPWKEVWHYVQPVMDGELLMQAQRQ